MRNHVILLMAGLSLLVPAAAAQESTSYRLHEHVFNSAGHPAAGMVPASATYRIRFDTVGETVAKAGLANSSFHMDGGFGNAYRPPGEVNGLRFTDKETFEWDPESSAGDYGVYRDLMSGLLGLGYGECLVYGLTECTADDTEPPPSGDGFFYLVTARNRLHEESTKGRDSDGAERPNAAPCP